MLQLQFSKWTLNLVSMENWNLIWLTGKGKLALERRKQRFLQLSRLHTRQLSSLSFATSICMLLSPPSGLWPEDSCCVPWEHPHRPLSTPKSSCPHPSSQALASKNLLPPFCFLNLLPLLHRQETHRNHSPNNLSEITSSCNKSSYDPVNWRTADDSIAVCLFQFISKTGAEDSQIKISKCWLMPRLYQMTPKGWFNQGWQSFKAPVNLS